MRAILETSLFLSLAAGVHLFVWPSEEIGGLQSSGSGGEYLISTMASNASVEKLVEQWETPPEPPQITAALTNPSQSETATDVSVQTQTVVTRDQVSELHKPDVPDSSKVEVVKPLQHQMETPDLPTVAEAPALPTSASQPVQQPEMTASLQPPMPVPAALPEAPQNPQRVKAPLKEKPKEKSSVASIEQSKKVAKGSGNKGAAGENKSEKTATTTNTDNASDIRKWGSKIHFRISKRAPKGAGKGTAVIKISVASSGQLLSLRLAKSSGNKKIDRLALAAVKKAAPFPKAPASLQGNQQSFAIPIKSQ